MLSGGNRYMSTSRRYSFYCCARFCVYVQDMPIVRLLQGRAFDPADEKIITSAFEDILTEMHLPRTDPVAMVVAKNVIRFARAGERDPARLRELASEFLRD